MIKRDFEMMLEFFCAGAMSLINTSSNMTVAKMHSTTMRMLGNVSTALEHTWIMLDYVSTILG